MRITTEKFGSGRQEWIGSRLGTDHAATGTLDPSNFTVTDGYIPAGTPVNQADLDDLQPWEDATGAVLGFILRDTPVDAGETEVQTAVLWTGRIILDELPVTLAAPATGDAGSFTLVGGAA